MWEWLHGLLAAFAEAGESFDGTAQVGGPMLPCSRVRPTVRLECQGGGYFRAHGSPVSGSGVYHWSISSGSAELSSSVGERVQVVRATPQTFDVDVYYEADGQFSDSARKTVTVVPRLIHFIWAGGTRLMPRESLEVVADWARVNAADGFKVVLWVDKATRADVVTAYQDTYAELLGGLPIELWDITEQGVVSAHARYEIDKLWPNYGSSSDLLRYAILTRFGGAYFDSDVLPGTKRLIESRHFLCCGEPFACHDQSQGVGVVGNDAFICAPGHPMMAQIHTTALGNYERVLYNRAEDYNKLIHLREDTVHRTGPGAVLRALRVEGHFREAEGGIPFLEDFVGGEPVALRIDPAGFPAKYKMDSSLVSLREGVSNTNGWLKVPVKLLTREQAIQVAVRSMRFEMAEMGMLRLEGTVKEILVAMTPSDVRAGREPSELIAAADARGEAGRGVARDLAEALGDVSALAPTVATAYAKFHAVVDRACLYEEFADLYAACTPH